MTSSDGQQDAESDVEKGRMDSHAAVQSPHDREENAPSDTGPQADVQLDKTWEGMVAKDIPWLQISCVLLCVASDSIALGSPLPYLPQFCRVQVCFL
jgi:hypothetical protein